VPAGPCSGRLAQPQDAPDVGYSNWELSSERANASRRELILGGMGEAKILRVVGLACLRAIIRQ
jgi:chemotaxis protein MotB